MKTLSIVKAGLGGGAVSPEGWDGLHALQQSATDMKKQVNLRTTPILRELPSSFDPAHLRRRRSRGSGRSPIARFNIVPSSSRKRVASQSQLISGRGLGM